MPKAPTFDVWNKEGNGQGLISLGEQVEYMREVALILYKSALKTLALMICYLHKSPFLSLLRPLVEGLWYYPHLLVI